MCSALELALSGLLWAVTLCIAGGAVLALAFIIAFARTSKPKESKP